MLRQWLTVLLQGKPGAGGPPPPLALSGTPSAVNEGQVFSFTPSRTGGTGPYTFSIAVGSLPAWATLNTSTGNISGTPIDGQNGTTNVTVRVTDATAATADRAISIVVNNSITAPSLSGSPSSVNEQAAFSFTPTRTGGVAPFTYNISVGTLPAWATLNTSTGEIYGTPANGQNGVTNVTVRVVDSRSAPNGGPQAATLPITITVVDSIPAISLSGSPSSVDEGASFSFTPTRTGGVGPYTYNISVGTLPSWASLNTSTGAITGNPADGDNGTTNVTVRVVDSASQVATLAISIVVNDSITDPGGGDGEFDPYYDPGFALVSNTTLYPRPTETKPASKATGYATASYIDQQFDTRIYRATDVADSPDASQTYLRHEYSRKQAFNADGTMFIAQSTNGYWYLYDALTFAKINGGRTISPGNTALGSGSSNQFAGDCEPTWHPTDPNKLWRTDQNGGLTWYEFDITTKATTTLFTLSGKLAAVGMSAGTRAWWQGEGRPSNDGRWWGLSIQDGAFNQIGLICYDRQTDTIVGSVTTSNKPNNVSTSPSGLYVIPSWSNGSGLSFSAAAAAAIGSTDGTRAYTRDFSSFQQMSYYGEHADTGTDADGNDVYISVNYNAGNMPDVTDGHLYYRRMDNGVAYTLPVNVYGGAQASALHVSGCAFDKPGWCVVGTYGSGAAQTGAVYTDDLVMLVELVPTSQRVLRLAHHQTRYSDYWDEPHSTPNRDLTKILFASDFGGTNRESYMIGLPSWAVPNVGEVPPSNLSAPVISGTATPGGTLSCTEGSWAGVGNTYAYQWRKDGVDVSGATSSTFNIPGSGYSGAVVTCRVTATNTYGSASATSNGLTVEVLSAPVNTVLPTASGGNTVGSTKTCSTGTWTGNPTPTYAYQWRKDISGTMTPISGQTSNTYVTTETGTFDCLVTATNSEGSASADTANFTVTAPVTPTVGVSATVTGSNADSNTTPSRTTQSSTTILAIMTGIAGGGSPTVTDNKGNTYTQIGSSVDLGSNAYYNDTYVYVCMNATGGANHTVTGARTGSYSSVSMVEIVGASAYTISTAARTAGSPYVSNSVSPSGAALLIGLIGAETSFDAVPVYNWSANSFTTVVSGASANDWAQSIAQRTVSSGTYTASCAVSGPTPLDGAAFVVSFT